MYILELLTYVELPNSSQKHSARNIFISSDSISFLKHIPLIYIIFNR
jgi:hypothetical protein